MYKRTIAFFVLAFIATLFFGDSLEASITFTPMSPLPGQTVTFTLNAATWLAPEHGIDWEFGDGATAHRYVDDRSITHSYSQPGTYLVRVHYYDGTFATDTATILVAGPKTVDYQPKQPSTCQTVTFQTSGFLATQLRWNFGDGTVISGATSASHAYSTAGTYTVRVFDHNGDDTSPASVQLQVLEKRSLSVLTTQPNTCQAVSFQAFGFLSGELRWDFGDGATATAKSSITHSYGAAGTYIVQVTERNGDCLGTARATVTVGEKRSLTLVTPQPRTGQPVVFQAFGFNSGCILWNFGDGQAPVQGGSSISHVFQKPGQFLVKAGDECGAVPCQASLTLNVEASQGPTAQFALSYIVLRFENGSKNVAIAKNSTGLCAYADLKFEGSGILEVQWQVDGKPFALNSHNLNFAGQQTINSPKIPGLPSQELGLHTVSLRILNPATAVIIPTISYSVVAQQHEPPIHSLLAPLIETVSPDSLDQGKEYTLTLQGKHLSADTVVTLGSGIAVNTFTFTSPQQASIKVFVAPTAKTGERKARAQNAKGSNTGPGQVMVNVFSKPPSGPIPFLCQDINAITMEFIKLTLPVWYTGSGMNTNLVVGKDILIEELSDGTKIWQHQVPENDKPQLTIPTVNDLTVLRWLPNGPVYDYQEVRFFDAHSDFLLYTQKLSSSASSLPLSGRILTEIFKSKTANAHKIAILAGIKEDSTPDILPPQVKFVYDGMEQADILWQVVGISRYPCVYDSHKPNSNQTDKDLAVACSERWMFKLPRKPTGIECVGNVMQQSEVDITVENQSKQAQQGSIDYVGDQMFIRGSFDLNNSPYGTSHGSQNDPSLCNLFVDWGDGSPAVPVALNKKEDGRFFIDPNNLRSRHCYQKALGNAVVRVFMLSEHDIQEPKDNYLGKLGLALQAKSPPAESAFTADPYTTLIGIMGGHAPTISESEKETFSQVLDRAYIIYCRPITIQPHDDLCARQPVKLAGIEITRFPGHSIQEPGAGGSASEGDIHLKASQVAVYAAAGIDAVAAHQCDKAVFAEADLSFLGSGYVQLIWYVDGVKWEERVEKLAARERPNLSLSQSSNCDGVEPSHQFFQSRKSFPVETLGKHSVRIEARVVSSFSLGNLGETAAQAVNNSMLPSQTSRNQLPGAQSRGPCLDSLSSATGVSVAGNQSQAPQIGFLNPVNESAGRPAAAYVNDIPGAGVVECLNQAGERVSSPLKHYQVNEIHSKLGCLVQIPDGSGAYFPFTDMMESVSQDTADMRYSGKGTLTIRYRVGNGSVAEAFIANIPFNKWDVQEETGILLSGTLKTSPKGVTDLSFPKSFVHNAVLTHLEGGAVDTVPKPMMASFNIDLPMSGLKQIKGGSNDSVTIQQASGRLSALNGDWMASGLHLDKSQFIHTAFVIESANGVSIDISQSENPPGMGAKPATWMGVHIGQARITPYTMDYTDPNFTVNTEQEWIVDGQGLNGKASGGEFSAKISKGSFQFKKLEFGVQNNVPFGNYQDIVITTPWLAAPLKGNATLMTNMNGSEYAPQLILDNQPPVIMSYQDQNQRGTVTLTASDEFFFRFDDETLFDGETGSKLFFPANQDSRFGPFPCDISKVTVTAPTGSSKRLDFAIVSKIKYAGAGMDQFIANPDALINYTLTRSGNGCSLNGPVTDCNEMTVRYPTVTSDFNGKFTPSYQPGSPSNGSAPGASGPSTNPGDDNFDASLSGTRFVATVPLQIFGTANLGDANFILGSQNGESYFMTFAHINISSGIPLSPIPFSIYGFHGGFGYHFDAPTLATASVDSQPNLNVTAAFSAGVTLGTTYDNGFTLGGDATLSGGSDGCLGVDFQDWKIFNMGGFGGHIGYANKKFGGNIFGQLNLFLIPLINRHALSLNLGDAGAPRIDFSFGDGDWHVYAGTNGVPITLQLIGIDGSGYLMLDDLGLRTGFSIKSIIPPGADELPISVYVSSHIGAQADILLKPKFHIYSNAGIKLGVGGCIICCCGEFDVSASVIFEAPDPTNLTVCFGIDWPLDGEDEIPYCLSIL